MQALLEPEKDAIFEIIEEKPPLITCVDDLVSDEDSCKSL